LQSSYLEKLKHLHSFASTLESLHNLKDIATATIRAADDILGYKRIIFLKLEGNILKVLASKPEIVIHELSVKGPSITARAARTGEPQLVPDVREDPGYVCVLSIEEKETLSEYAVPVKVRGETVGVLNIESSELDGFTDQDIELLTILVDHLTSALNRLVYQDRLTALHSYVTELGEASNLMEVADKTWKVVSRVFEVDTGSFAVVEETALNHVFIRGVSGEFKQPLDGQGVTIRAVRTGESQLVPDVRLDPDYVKGLTVDEVETHSELCTPIKLRGKVVAVINLESSRLHAFTTEDVQLLELLAGHVSSLYHQIQYRAKLEALHRHAYALKEVGNLRDIVETTTEVLDETLDFNVFDIIRVTKNSLQDINTSSPKPFETPLDGPGITARSARLGETQLVNDTRNDPDYIAGPYETPLLSELVVPVKVDGKVALLLNVENREPDAFTSEDQHLVETLALHLTSALERLNREETLEQAVKERTWELEQANIRLRKLNEMKTRFVSNATHELRTPLTVLKGYLEISQGSDSLSKIHEYLEIASRNVDRLETVTDDLLDQQRIEEGRLELNRREVKLDELVASIVAEMRGLLGEKNQSIETVVEPGLPLVCVDPNKIGQVLVNLLDNASKYSPEGSVIKISVGERDKLVKVSVTDEGIGLSEEDLGKLFLPFPDIRRPVVTAQSVGLGLSVCRGVVELHGGRIWAESPGPGQGSTFIFTLPTALG